MEYNHNQQDINQFFERFKQLPDFIELDEVHQLIQNQDAKPKLKLKSKYKFLKFIIMTSIIIVVLSSIIIWFSMDNSKNKANLIKSDMALTMTDTGSGENFTKHFKENYNSGSLNEKPEKQTINANLSKTNQSTVNEREPVGLSISGIFKDLKQKDKLKGKNDSVATNNLIINNLIQSEKKEENCNWPDDTIIDKKTLLVELTDTELKKIGVLKKGSSFYYHNIWASAPPMYSKNESSNFPEEEKITTHNFYHQHFSSYLNFVQGPFGRDAFFSSIDTLVPVIIDKTNYSPHGHGTIWWFNPHKTLFEAFPDRYKYLERVYDNLRCLKNKFPNKSFTNYLSPTGNIDFEPVRSIELKKEELREIGVNIIDSCIIIKSEKSRICECFNNAKEDFFGQQADLSKQQEYFDQIFSNKDIKVIPYESLPVLKTDTIGRVIMSKRPSIGAHIETLNLLVPVKIDIHKLLNQGDKPFILWFEPTDDFIKALPAEIRNQLKWERDAIIKGNKITSASCTYFEVCKSTLKVNEFIVFPNPVVNSTTISFKLPEITSGEIKLININGSKNRTLVKQTRFQQGKNTFDVDLTDLIPGIYIIQLETNNGFWVHRIIKA